MAQNSLLRGLILSAIIIFPAAQEALAGISSHNPPSAAPFAQTILAQSKPADSSGGMKITSKNAPGYSFEGSVIGLNLENGMGVINIGKSSSVKLGDSFVVVRIKERVSDPSSGKIIKVIQEFVGSVEVTAVFDTYSDVKLSKGAKYIQKGDQVRRVPKPPSGVTAKNIGARKIEVDWNISYEPEVEGYKIYRASASDPKKFSLRDTVSKRGTISYQDKGSGDFPIVESETYHYRVTTYSLLEKESKPSSTVTIKSKSAPQPPSGFSTESGKIRSAPLWWEPITDKDVAGYLVYRSSKKKGPFQKIEDVSKRETSSYTDFGGGKPMSPQLADSTQYFYKISAYNIFKTEGPQSDPVSSETAPPPKMVTGFTAKGMQPRMVPLTWDTHPDINVKGYLVYRGDSMDGPYKEVVNIKGREINNYVDKGTQVAGWGKKPNPLEDAHLYFYKVQAYNWVNSKSKLSVAVPVMTKPVSFPPENFVATSNRPGQVPLEWRPVPDITIAWYEIFKSETLEGKFIKIGAIKSDKSHYLDDKLPNGTTYFYKIRALDKFGLIGEFTEPLKATTKHLPVKVSGLRWEIISGEPTLLWDPNPEVDIKEYNIHQKGFFGWSKAGSSSESRYIIKGLSSGSSANFAVSAIDADGLEGEMSASTTVRP